MTSTKAPRGNGWRPQTVIDLIVWVLDEWDRCVRLAVVLGLSIGLACLVTQYLQFDPAKWFGAAGCGGLAGLVSRYVPPLLSRRSKGERTHYHRRRSRGGRSHNRTG